MPLAIIGSRNCPAVDIEVYLDELPDAIVSGGAKGADTYAREFAIKKGIRLIEHLPDYAKYGRAAPLVRNRLIIDDCDKVLAFWDGKSRGTKQSLDYAESKGKPVKIIRI
jgi:predicted Rossmann fold nucleotide-binding protein DprA/Smf involved in DNA uptake